jgi:hypothetical protein
MNYIWYYDDHLEKLLNHIELKMKKKSYAAVLWIRIHRILMFFGLLDPYSSIIKQK